MRNESYTNIFDAAEKGTIEDVRYFIEKEEVDVNAIDTRCESKFTALHHAVSHNSVEMIDYLLSQGADPKMLTRYGWGLLHLAAQSNTVQVLEYLVVQGFDAQATTDSGMTALFTAACDNPDVEVLTFLVSLGLDPMAADQEGKTPVCFSAAFNSNSDVFDYLVALGGKCHSKNRGFECRHGKLECLKSP